MHSFRRRKNLIKNKNGFTIVEVVIALVIFGVMMAAIIPAYNVAISHMADARNYTSANIETTGSANNNTPSDLDTIRYSGGGSWLTDPNQDYNNASIGLVESTVNGATVKYFYYVPYHPYRCGNDCPKCSKADNFGK